MHIPSDRPSTYVLALAFFLLSLAGCSSPQVTTPLAVAPTRAAVAPSDVGAATSSVVTKTPSVHPLDDAQSVLAGRTVYFQYDSARVAPSSAAMLEAHSAYLRSHTGAKVRLEGHADERGGREYNLALGQKRSDAVRQSLKLLGVPDGQMESVSYGKEKPAATGHDEESWSKNRKVDIAYQAR